MFWAAVDGAMVLAGGWEFWIAGMASMAPFDEDDGLAKGPNFNRFLF